MTKNRMPVDSVTTELNKRAESLLMKDFILVKSPSSVIDVITLLTRAVFFIVT